MAQPYVAKTAASADTAASQNRLKIVLVIVSVAFFWTSLYFYVPTLSIYAQTKTRDLALVGTIVSMYGLWQGLLRLPLGITADWVGRRKIFILIGILLSALGAWVMGSAAGPVGLLVGRSITGLAAAAWVPFIVLFSSLYPPQETVRATAILSIVNSVGCMLGSSLNGLLIHLGGYTLPFNLSIAAAAVALVTLVPVAEPAFPQRRPSPRSILTLITRRDVYLPAFLSALTQYISWATTFGFLPILAKNLGATADLNSLLVIINLGLSMVGSLVTTAIVRRIGNLGLIYLSFPVIAAGIVAAALAQSLAVVVLAQVLIGLGYGVGYPIFMGMSIEKVDPAERATAMGLHQAVYSIGMFTGPWLSGILANSIGIQPMFAGTAAAFLVVGFSLARFIQRKD